MWVVSLPRKEMQVKMRERIAVDLVVHLDRPHHVRDGLSDQQGFLPEPCLLGRT